MASLVRRSKTPNDLFASNESTRSCQAGGVSDLSQIKSNFMVAPTALLVPLSSGRCRCIVPSQSPFGFDWPANSLPTTEPLISVSLSTRAWFLSVVLSASCLYISKPRERGPGQKNLGVCEVWRSSHSFGKLLNSSTRNQILLVIERFRFASSYRD